MARRPLIVAQNERLLVYVCNVCNDERIGVDAVATAAAAAAAAAADRSPGDKRSDTRHPDPDRSRQREADHHGPRSSAPSWAN